MGYGTPDGSEKWGYVEVRPKAHMFWWYYKSPHRTQDPNNPWPVILWLQGGPGGSGVGIGNFEEVGPLDSFLKPRNSTWLKKADLLFVDNPVGTGFSYVEDDGKFVKTDEEAARDLTTLLIAIFNKDKTLQKSPLYMVAESYGGKYAVTLGLSVLKAIKDKKLKLILGGIALGDSWISPEDFVASWGPFLKDVSRIDDNRLMVLDKDHGVITFTDPLFGDKYSLRTPPELIGDLHIWCSMYGWLLISKGEDSMMLFNPFTSDIRKLPNLDACFFESFCFSAPPSSPNCMVAGFEGPDIYIHFVNREPATWFRIGLELDGEAPSSIFCFSTSCGQDLYALNSEGQLSIFTNVFVFEKDGSWDYVDVAPTSCSRSSAQYFLVKHDQDLLLVTMDRFGECVELFKMDLDAKKWGKIDGIGKHVIYICDQTGLCMEARTPDMENKIIFPVSKKGKMVFYSLDTCTYHTFSGKSIGESFGDLFGTRQHFLPQAWIEPSYS